MNEYVMGNASFQEWMELNYNVIVWFSQTEKRVWSAGVWSVSAYLHLMHWNTINDTCGKHLIAPLSSSSPQSIRVTDINITIWYSGVKKPETNRKNCL